MSNAAPDEMPRRGETYAVGWMLPVMLGLVVAGLSALLTGPSLDVESRDLVDTDGYMRFVRILDLRTGDANWFESFEARSNAPFGHSMHWTRPFDLTVILLSLIALPFSDVAGSLYAAAVVVGPLMLGAIAAALAWAAFPLVGRVGSVVAGLAVALQPGLAAYGAVGRLDHHGPIFLLAAVLAGLVIRLGLGRRRSTASWAGLVAGLGIWVSTEFLLPIALVLVGGAIAWLRIGAEVPALMRRFSLTWLATLAAALFVERGLAGLTADELDRISWLHCLVALVALVFWIAVEARDTATFAGRLAVGLAGGAAGLVVVAFVEPRFLSGPFGDVPAELWEGWLAGVAELQPLWPVGEGFHASLYLLAAPVTAIGLALFAARLSGNTAVWLAVGGVLAVLTALGISQFRLIPYAQLISALPWAYLAVYLIDRVPNGTGIGSSLRRVGAMLIGIAGFLVPVLSVELVIPATSASPSVASECSFDGLVRITRAADQPVVLAHVDYGSELLYRTDAGVVASSYHRNIEGILDARRFMLGEENVARSIAAVRGVDLVFVCPTRDLGYLGAAARSAESMFTRLSGGDEPAWLIPIPTDDDLLAFRVEL